MFDVAQRHQLPPDILSISMTHPRFEELTEDADSGALSSHSWKALVKKRDWAQGQ